MVRLILGIIVGFAAWSILWLGSDQVLMLASPDWYGVHQLEFEKAMFNRTDFIPDTAILVMHIFRAVIVSIMAGFLAAFIANENTRSTLILGVLLFAFGLLVQIAAWNYIPIWYHIIFLALLIPMTIAGGKMRTSPSPVV
jgi:ABC-type microcin C transport system permease subunit YejB